jgi:hypothetical protein
MHTFTAQQIVNAPIAEAATRMRQVENPRRKMRAVNLYLRAPYGRARFVAFFSWVSGLIRQIACPKFV